MTKARFFEAILKTLPLALPTMPWGFLCASVSLETGLSNVQAQLMSLLVYAGAAQLSGLAVIAGGGGLATIINNTVMINSRCLLYSAYYKDHVRPLPFWKRASFAFLLVDQIFLLAQEDLNKHKKLDFSFVMVCGLTIYVLWNLATLAGIIATSMFTGIESMGLDFAIPAVFIAMTVPRMKHSAMIVGAAVSGALSVVFSIMGLNSGLIIAGCAGMICAFAVSKRVG